MVFNTEIEVELATRTNTVMVPVCCEYTINNDGRGVYERGSERGGGCWFRLYRNRK